MRAMDADTIQRWLRRKRTAGVGIYGLLSLGALLGGIVVLFLTFWLTYAVIWVGGEGISAVVELLFRQRLALPHGWRLVGSGVFIGLLFLQHFRTDPWHWGDYPKGDYAAAPGLASQAGVAGGLAVLIAYPGASANMIADMLLSGPRLVTGAWGLLTKAVRLRRLDEPVVAQLLAFLCSRAGAVPYEELQQAGWAEHLPPLRCLEGVLFLEGGLSLSAELREELGELGKG